MTTHQATPSEIAMIFLIKIENKFNMMFIQKNLILGLLAE
jgi:hypothetical protein